MLSLDHYELIRRKHLIDGLSIREVSRTLGHSRKTIRKALAHPTPPGYQRAQPAPSPVMEPVAKIVDAWLEQDKQRPRKQRHTSQATMALLWLSKKLAKIIGVSSATMASLTMIATT